MHRNVIHVFAKSLENQPPGMYTLSAGAGDVIVRLSSTIFSTGFKLALPLVALLVMVDLAMALLSLVNAQLQLHSMAFPAKILVTLAFLAAISTVFPQVFTGLRRPPLLRPAGGDHALKWPIIPRHVAFGPLAGARGSVTYGAVTPRERLTFFDFLCAFLPSGNSSADRYFS